VIERNAVLAIMLLAAAWGPAAAAQQGQGSGVQGGGQVIADSGFRPNPHGFSFANWGGEEHPQAQLTADDAAYLFGDQVCARKQGESCVPTPAASMWITEMNRATEGGHCEGMAALSAAFYVKSEQPKDYGAANAFALRPDDVGLMRTISTYYSTQALEPVQSTTSATRGWSLQQIVDHLGQTLAAGRDYPTLGIYGPDGGHAVTPYRLEAQGAGRYRIHVYDNNYPGAEKYIDVDVANDRWTYGGAALNPGEAPTAWQGGAGSMDITLLSNRYQQLKCPFCGPPIAAKPKPKPSAAQATRPKPKPQVSRPKPATAQAVAVKRPKPARRPATASQGYSVITPSRCTQVQAVGKNDKKQIRMGNAGPRSQIAGASMRPMRGSRGCVVSLPPGQEYDVRLLDDGKPSARPLTGMTVFSPGKVYSVSDVAIRPGAAQTVRLGGSAFTYRAGGGEQTPTVRVAGGNESGNSYYEVSGLTINEGYNFRAGEDESGRVSFSGDDPELEAFDIRAEVVGEEETVVYDYEDVDVEDDGQVLMALNEDGEVDIDFDSLGEDEVEEFDTEEEYDALLEDDAADEDASDDSEATTDEESDEDADESFDESADAEYEAEAEAEDGSEEADKAAVDDESYEEAEAEEESYESAEAEEESYEEAEAEEESYEEAEAEEESYEEAEVDEESYEEAEAEEESYEEAEDESYEDAGE
jgi:hypothetical protein